MSSTTPDAASPEPAPDPVAAAGPAATTDPSSPPPRTRREAAVANGWARPDGSTLSGALVAMGLLAIVLGVLVLAWPGATLLVVAVTFGLQLIVAGAVRLAMSRDLPADPRWLRPVSMGLGALSVVAGVVCLFRPGASLLAVAIIIAAGWLAEGVAAIAQGVGSGRSTGTRVYLVVSGIVSVVAGLLVAVFPGSSLVLLARLAGIMLILIGVAEVVTAVVARRARSGHSSTPTAPTPPAATPPVAPA